MKKIYLAAVCILLAGLTACGNKTDSPDKTETSEPTAEVSESTPNPGYEIHKATFSVQDTSTEAGETLATLHVKDYGDITVKFFPNEAPKAVENFITHAKEGYYDGTIFHRVIYDFMIQGGDPAGDGSGGESIWGTDFEDEFAEQLVPIRGALCMANSGVDTNASQFFIVQTTNTNEELFDQLGLTKEQEQKFLDNGGTPWLTNAHTVFGQVVSGMDVVDAIVQVETSVNDTPKEDVVIENITIEDAK